MWWIFSVVKGETLYWSNSTGWGSKESATPFTHKEKEKFNLPTNYGYKVYWVFTRYRDNLP